MSVVAARHLRIESKDLQVLGDNGNQVAKEPEMRNFLHDIQFGCRPLRRDLSFSLTAILTLTICLGANAALFTIIDSVLLRPLPLPDSSRMVVMADQFPKAGMNRLNVSGPTDYFDRLQGITGLDEQAMFNGVSETVQIGGKPERLRAMAVTPSWFRLLAVQPQLGRGFTEKEGESGNDRVVVLSHGLWQEMFGGDRNAIGRQIRIGEEPRTIVGVMPRSFQFLSPEFRLWIPLVFTDKQKSDENRYSDISYINLGRMKPGVTVQQIQTQVNALNASIADRFPASKAFLANVGFSTTVELLQDMVVRDIRSTLYLLWGGAAFVLLIGAVNLTNVVTARSNARQKEMATRFALGAAREDIHRQLLIESLIVTSAGTVAALGFGVFILKGLSILGLERMPRVSELHMDFVVVAFTIALAALTGFVIAWASGAAFAKTTWSQAFHGGT
jgi:predicted permease